ncbi:MAG: LLM class flavin-dependent oxidoreductase [Acidimicrobiia bacterium]|nr:LLM class flavin-dependent oxidoreductase [Acidimicrobiia bacterium]
MSEVTVGLSGGTQPPLRQIDMAMRLAKTPWFDTLWTVDHFVGFFPKAIWDEDFSWMAKPGTTPDAYYDYQTLLGYLAAKAGNVRLAVGVTEPIRRHPMLLAQAFLTLTHMVKRRPILGIGSGERENIEPYGLDFSAPVSRLDEALQIIRSVFDSAQPVDFSGRFHQLDHAEMDLRPGPVGAPEIWVAAHGPRMLRLTGTYGDGWWPTLPMTPDEYSGRLHAIRSAARLAGRDPSAITPGYQVFCVIGRSERHARKLLDSPPARLSALLATDEVWQAAGLVHPLGEGFGGMIDIIPSQYSSGELRTAMAEVPVDLLADLVVWGTKERILDQLRDYVEAGLRHVSLAPVSGLVSRRDAIGAVRSLVWIARRLRSGR